MGDIFFFVRTMVLTFIVVLFMQVRWGQTTIENHAMQFLTTSSLVTPIEQTAGGTVVFIRNMWNRFTHSLNTKFSHSLRDENQPGSRHEQFSLKRSEDYIHEKTQNLRSHVSRVKDKIGEKFRTKFKDETHMPGSDTTSAASDSGDDESLEE